MVFFFCIYLLLAFYLAAATAIPTIHALGSKFFDSDGHQWFIKGVAYQLIEDDPLVNTDQCERDAALMQILGANAIRVYHVNETADHSGCMNAFAARGIYVFVDLDSFKTYVSFEGKPSWTEEKAASYRKVMDNFQQFDNTAGFFIGNEVLNSQADSHAAPFLLAAAVDMKKYRDAKEYREIPVGYSATDTGALRPMLQDYVVCRPDAKERIDFYAVNTYSWCGPETTYNTSGYPMLQKLAEDYPVPIWMSEDGCNTLPPRNFKDQDAVFGLPMVETWSGAMIYEWIQEMNHYGLVSYGPALDPSVQDGNKIVQGFTREGQPSPVQPDFSNLQQVWATISPSGVEESDYTATFTTKAPECPPFTDGGWSIHAEAVLPTLSGPLVVSGVPGEVPKGSITVTGVSSATGSVQPSGSTGPSESPNHIHPGASTSSSDASPSASTAGAVRDQPNPLTWLPKEAGLISMLAALMAAGAAFAFFL